MYSCSSLLSIAVMDTMTKSNMRGEGFIADYRSQSLIEENKDKNSRQELNQKPRKNAT